MSPKHLVLASTLLIAMSRVAGATPILSNPDLTLSELSITYNAPNLLVQNADPLGGFISWTDSLGANAGLTLGTSLITWDGLTGVIQVYDSLATNLLLNGWIAGFATNGSSFDLLGILTTSDPLIGLGNRVLIQIHPNSGTADINPVVPEPATLGILGLGLAVTAVRRRFKPRP